MHSELVASLPTVRAVEPGKTILTRSGFPHSARVTRGYEAKGQLFRACFEHQMAIDKYVKSASGGKVGFQAVLLSNSLLGLLPCKNI